jgi:hypothetical protein
MQTFLAIVYQSEVAPNQSCYALNRLRASGDLAAIKFLSSAIAPSKDSSPTRVKAPVKVGLKIPLFNLVSKTVLIREI